MCTMACVTWMEKTVLETKAAAGFGQTDIILFALTI